MIFYDLLCHFMVLCGLFMVLYGLFFGPVWPFYGLSWLYIAFSPGHRSKFISSCSRKKINCFQQKVMHAVIMTKSSWPYVALENLAWPWATFFGLVRPYKVLYSLSLCGLLRQNIDLFGLESSFLVVIDPNSCGHYHDTFRFRIAPLHPVYHIHPLRYFCTVLLFDKLYLEKKSRKRGWISFIWTLQVHDSLETCIGIQKMKIGRISSLLFLTATASAQFWLQFQYFRLSNFLYNPRIRA